MTVRISNINEGVGPTIPNAILRKVVEKRGASAWPVRVKKIGFSFGTMFPEKSSMLMV